MPDDEKQEVLENAEQYMQRQFMDIADGGRRPVYPYVTCAT